ncbi:hypothetical protein HanIR_Chr01g0023761 [Helianthus annuus]|nr:hypothetical protein HanIR_Chr01g0023761 [Helianthus annuus]
MTKALLRKRWLFPDEMQIGFMEHRRISHSLAGKICGHERRRKAGMPTGVYY